jgi:hypothetical protein
MNMQKTTMAQQYKYYVYVCPGHIRYFTEREFVAAQEYARYYDAEVKEMDV